MLDALTEGDAGRIQYRTWTEWLRAFAAAGLVLVGARRDLALPSALFLLRRAPQAVPTPRLVTVDDLDKFSWVQELKEAVAVRFEALLGSGKVSLGPGEGGRGG